MTKGDPLRLGRLGRSRALPLAPYTAVACLLLGGAVPAADAPSWRVAKGDVRVTVPLQPGGAFEAHTSSLSGTLTLAAPKPAQLTGELVVDLTTIDTGIDLRNRHLREKYLEVAKGTGYDKAVLSEIRLADADGEAFEGKSPFTGMLRLHNVARPLSGTAEIRRAQSGAQIVASFALQLTDFGIEPPQYMGVGVANRLGVKVSFTAGRGSGK
jgi:polyisoprenoid-binding protein YceI